MSEHTRRGFFGFLSGLFGAVAVAQTIPAVPGCICNGAPIGCSQECQCQVHHPRQARFSRQRARTGSTVHYSFLGGVPNYMTNTTDPLHWKWRDQLEPLAPEVVFTERKS